MYDILCYDKTKEVLFLGKALVYGLFKQKFDLEHSTPNNLSLT